MIFSGTNIASEGGASIEKSTGNFLSTPPYLKVRYAEGDDDFKISETFWGFTLTTPFLVFEVIEAFSKLISTGILSSGFCSHSNTLITLSYFSLSISSEVSIARKGEITKSIAKIPPILPDIIPVMKSSFFMLENSVPPPLLIPKIFPSLCILKAKKDIPPKIEESKKSAIQPDLSIVLFVTRYFIFSPFSFSSHVISSVIRKDIDSGVIFFVTDISDFVISLEILGFVVLKS